MVDLDHDVGRLARPLVADLLVDEADEAPLHVVGRDEQLLETHRRIGPLDELEGVLDVLHDGARGGHQQEVGVHLGVALVEIAGADAGDVVARAHLDVGDLRVYLQPLDAEDDVDARVLHLFRPVDVRRLVEAGQQLDDDRHLLAVAGGADQGLHHFRLLGQAIERRLDRLHLLVDRRLLKDADVAVEAVVGDVDEAVLLLDLLEQALGPRQLALHDGRPRRVFQVAPAAVGELHQVAVVLVAPAGQDGVELVEVQLAEHLLQQVLRHAGVVDHPQGLALLAALDALGYLLQRAVAQVVVDLHLGVFRELERVGLEVLVFQPDEDEREAAAHDVFHVHQVMAPLAGGQLGEAAADADRQLQQRVFGLSLLGRLLGHLDGHVDVLVALVVDLRQLREPGRVDEAVQLPVIIIADEGPLLVVDLVVAQEVDIVVAQLVVELRDGLLIFLGVFAVQLIDLFQQFLRLLLLLLGGLVLALGDAALCRHTDPEKLVEVVRVDSQETQPLEQGNVLLACLLQDTAVKIHPADVSRQVIILKCFFLRHNDRFFAKFGKKYYKVVSGGGDFYLFF